ncbi:MAG: hypothetical protein NWE89_17345 [Candidatus Bathyarchaeota archaeon]|nr:hypothetical protein [Candidatus Bathyarchaeota archaeon]
MVFNVTIDFSFIEENLPIIHYPDDQKMLKMVSHDAAKGIYNHAKRFHNTDKDINDFWHEKLQQESNKGKRHLENVLECIEYIKQNTSDFNEAFRELEAYLPRETDFSSILFCIIGYDIGVVSDGDAYLNLGHPLFHENKRELLYIAMHELHHVAYTQLNPIFSFDDLETTEDLSRIVRYSTHLEGFAVYSSLNRRRRENGYTHRDYITLNDPDKMIQLSTQFFEILDKLENEPCRALVDDDWDILEVLSDGERLWYVVGAWMAESIDRVLGREALNSTMVQGPEAFFKAYHKTGS